MRTLTWSVLGAVALAALVVIATPLRPSAAQAAVMPRLSVAALRAGLRAGTARVPFTLSYAGAQPRVTRVRVALRRDDGRLEDTVVVRLPHARGRLTGTVGRYPSLRSGAYRLVAIVDGRTTQGARLWVRPGLVVPVAYTTSEAGVVEAGHATAPRPTSTLPAGTRSIGYYIAYSGARPGRTRLVVHLYEKGRLVESASTVYRLRYADGYVASAFQALVMLPPGGYRLVVTNGGHVLRTWGLTIGHGVRPEIGFGI